MTEEKSADMHERLLLQTILDKLSTIEANQIQHAEDIASVREKVGVFSTVFGIVGGVLTVIGNRIFGGHSG